MKKDIFIAVSIWLLGAMGAAWLCACLWNNYMISVLAPEINKYSVYADRFENVEIYDGIDDGRKYGGILAMRRLLSDHVLEDQGYRIENAFIFSSSHGDFEMSEGIYGNVIERSDDGSFNAISGVRAVYNLEQAMQEGYGEKVYAYITEHEEGGVRVDRYAIKNGICHPLEISFTDEYDEVVSVMSFNEKMDLSGFEVCTSDNEWMYHQSIKGVLSLKEAYEDAGTELKATEYAQQIKDKVEYPSFKIIEKKKFSLTGVTYSVISTSDNYSMIRVVVIENKQVSLRALGVGAGIWSFPAIVVGTVVICVRQSRRKKRGLYGL